MTQQVHKLSHTDAAPRFRSKLTAALLALFLGAFGAHAYYLGRRHFYIPLAFTLLMLCGAAFSPDPTDNAFLHLLIIPVTAGIIESAVLALRDPQRFDQRYNPGRQERNRLGWPSVLTAIAAAMAFVNISLYWLAVVVIAVYDHLGWLDTSGY